MVELHNDSPLYQEQYVALYEATFPANERRDTQQWLQMDNPSFQRQIVLYDNAFAGFITLWHFAGFVYVEHFAVLPALRGLRIGATVLEYLQQTIDKPLVLEVETPDNEMAQRRIGFYQRAGFTLFPQAYQQPPYKPSFGWTPMMIMATRLAPTDECFNHIAAQLHKEVYGVA